MQDRNVGLLDPSHDFGVRPLDLISDLGGRRLHLGEGSGICGVRLDQDFLGKVSGYS